LILRPHRLGAAEVLTQIGTICREFECYQRGKRPRMVKNQRYRSAYIFGAVCPARDTGTALVITHVSITAMNLLLEEVASQLPRGTHAVMLIDIVGWPTSGKIGMPANISLLILPPYSPALNGIEPVLQYFRDRYLSERLFTRTSEIIDACCDVGKRLIEEPGRIRSLTNLDRIRVSLRRRPPTFSVRSG